MGGDDKTRINHPVYEVKQGDPEFQEVWKKLPDETEAQKLVKKLSMGDQRKLMVEEGTPHHTHALRSTLRSRRPARRARACQSKPATLRVAERSHALAQASSSMRITMTRRNRTISSRSPNAPRR